MDFELAQVAELSWSKDLRVSAVRGAAVDVFGRDAESLVGQPLHEVLEVSPERAQELDARARRAEAPIVEFASASRTHASSLEHRHLRMRIVLRSGHPVAAVMDLNALLAGAPPVQISRLSSSLSHEIRNPLSSVKMAVQTLAKNAGHSERDARRLAIAAKEIRTMERMLWLLSEYGRDQPPVLETLPLKQLVQEAAALIDPELVERKVTVAIDEAPDLPRVRVDPGRLRPVLAQVILNAAMSVTGGGALPVKLVRSESGPAIVLEDASAALPPEERAMLFEPFGSRLARGAGLSLAALQRVIAGFGGVIHAHGGEAPPTVLTVCFPA